jgi:hypothetical protein
LREPGKRTLSGNAMALGAAFLAMNLPGWTPDQGVTWVCLRLVAVSVMFAPWIHTFWRFRQWSVFSVGFLAFVLGGLRAGLNLGWAFNQLPAPALAMLLGFAWSGLLHGLVALVLFLALRRSKTLFSVAAALAVPGLDFALAYPAQLPAPYLTSVYTAAAVLPAPVMARLGWFGMALLIGLTSTGVAWSWCTDGAVQRWIGFLPATVMVVTASWPGAAGPRLDGSLDLWCFRSGPDYRAWDPKLISDAGFSLVVLPEEAIFKPFGDGVDQDLPKESIDLAEVRHLHSLSRGAGLICGVFAPAIDGSFRNALLVRQPDLREHWWDKSVAVPGTERVPFQGVPMLGGIFTRISGVEGTMILGKKESRVEHIGPVRVASSICFEHCMLSSETAWGVETGASADLLVSIGYLASFGVTAPHELVRSRPARRYHAARLRAPLVYVTDVGVEYVTPDGRVIFSTYPPSGWVKLTIPIAQGDKEGQSAAARMTLM